MKSRELKEYGRKIGYSLMVNGEYVFLIAQEKKNGRTRVCVRNLTKRVSDEGLFDIEGGLTNKKLSEITPLVNQLEESYNKENKDIDEQEVKYEFAQILNSVNSYN